MILVKDIKKVIEEEKESIEDIERSKAIKNI